MKDMKYQAALLFDSAGRIWYRRREARRLREVLTVTQVCRRLGRSRRQIYRSLGDGRLEGCGKPLGEWLITAESVAKLEKAPPAIQRLPARLRPLFPEYDLSSINAGVHRDLIFKRVMELGTDDDVRWMKRRYRPSAIRAFLGSASAGALSARAKVFWGLVFRVQVPTQDFEWRKGPTSTRLTKESTREMA